MKVIDLFNPHNYLVINKEAIKILGLTNALYSSIIYSIYNKVIKKNKFINEHNYFEIDRNYIEKEICLSLEEQLKCDFNLEKLNIIKIDLNNPNIIYFDINTYSCLLRCEDEELLNNIHQQLTINNPKLTKQKSKKIIIQNIKNSIQCKTPEIITRLYTWIDSIYEVGKGISKSQVLLFKEELDKYCNGDINKAIKLLDIAIATNYTNFDWIKQNYEKEYNKNSCNFNNTLKIGEQKKTTKISDAIF